jgi:hypothetical protein
MRSIIISFSLLFFSALAIGAGETRVKGLISAGPSAIGKTTAADSKSILELSSTTLGFLPPRLTTTQQNAISSPTTGLWIFNSTDARPSFYNGTGWLGVATLTGTETLTGKTMSGSSNTFTNIPNSATTATNANTASTIVARDGSGNFSAGTITANLTGAVTGNASTSTALAADPTDCSAGQYATTIAANGNLTCAQVATSQLSGTLGISSGGTGQTTANTALNALVPTQTSNGGKYLKTDGSNTSWAAASGGGGDGYNYITNTGAETDTSGYSTYSEVTTFTVTIASPAVFTVGSTTGYYVGMPVYLSTSGALPTGLTTNTTYYISSVASSTTFKVSATSGGADVNTSGSQSGTHTVYFQNPQDGTGGSASITLSRVTGATALRDDDQDGTVAGFDITKGASNRMGDGVAYDFTLASADYSNPQMQTISFNYKVTANFLYTSPFITQSDIVVYIYARDTGVLIQPTVFKLDGSGKYVGQFQPLTTDSNYRLILAVGSTNANSWDFYFDSVKVGPQNIARGPPMSDWIDFPSVAAGTLITATTSSPTFGTTAVNKAQYRRVGSELEIEWDFRQTTNGTAGTGMYLFNIPAASGCTIDTSKKAVNTGTAINASFMDSSVGDLNVHYPGGSFRSTMTAVPYSTTQLKFFQMAVANGGVPAVATWSSAASTWLDAVVAISLHAKVPCSGWSSNTQNVIDEGRDVEAEYNGNGGTAITANVTDITFSTKVKDSHSAWSGTAYIAPLDGEYEVSGAVLYNAGIAGAVIDLYVNGVAKARVGGNTGATTSSYPFSGKLFLSKGDSLTVRSNTSGTLSSSTSAHRIVVSRSSGRGSLPQPTETVSARYTTVAGQTCTAGNTCIVNYGTMDWDTHGAVTTGASWKYTALIPGKYRVTASVVGDAGAAASTQRLDLYKNGSLHSTLDYRYAYSTAGRVAVLGSGEISLNAGDYIDTRWFNGDSGTRTMINSVGFNFITVTKVGN